MSQEPEILSKPPVGGMDLCRNCGHFQWEHNVDVVVDGKVVRPRTTERHEDICLHEGSLRCCMAFCRKFEAGA